MTKEPQDGNQSGPGRAGRFLGRVTGTVCVLVTFGMGGELLAAALTGRVERAYSTLDQQAMVTVAGDSLSLEAVARAYRPTVYIASQYIPPDVLNIWYQAVDRGDLLTLVYYLDWENEIHPQPIAHRLYELYRLAVYGSTHDIEFIEITVDRQTGDVAKVRYETSPAGIYNCDIPVHLVAVLKQNAARDGYEYTVSDRESGELLKTDVIPGTWKVDRPLTLKVFTWNHMYTLAGSVPDSQAGVVIDAPLRYLTDPVYIEHKFARRSQGDIVTRLDETPRNLLRLLFWCVGGGVLVWLWRRKH